MPKVSRDEIDAALRDHVVPALRSRGFQGWLPHFRRILPDRIDLLTVQFDHIRGGRFVVEISRCGPAGVTTLWGKEIPPNKVTAHDVRYRHRLGSAGTGRDGHWFRYDDGTSAETVAVSLAAMPGEADRWWNAGV